MLLYHIHDWQHAVMTPWRLAAEVTQAAFQNPYVPVSYTPVGRSIAASAELFRRTTGPLNKPVFNITSTLYKGEAIDVQEEVIVTKPFCRLLHFKRSSSNEFTAKRLSISPRVLIVAPISGHHATLLRGTVEAMLPDHDVYITDWIDAKNVPLAQGKFDLEDNISYLIEFLRVLGPNSHVIGISQAAVTTLCAVALLADRDPPFEPLSMTLMGGPIDTQNTKTILSAAAAARPLEWFQNAEIQALPFYYAGAYRLVYPGFLQLQDYMSMNVDAHVNEHFKFFKNLVRGDDDAAEAHRKFYDEYLSVMDIPAELYLQEIERFFQKCDLPNGTFRWHDILVKPQAIKHTALLTIEGEMDDITAPGQTAAAHNLCSGLSPDMKQSHLEIGVGHYGIFNGRKWRNNIQPVVKEFIRVHQGR